MLVDYFTDERTLFVISSDFCHWGERFQFTHKFDDFTEGQIYKSIEKLDREGMAQIESQCLAKFQSYLDRTKNTICGRNPISILMALIEMTASDERTYKTEFVKYDQSSSVKDFGDSSVSYASSITYLQE